MPYDLFISYSRRDNEQRRITEFVERIGRDFESFAGRPLRPFFDITDIQGMDDWRHRILQGLRESRLLLAFVSPNYLQSEYCEWEFYEYVKNEVARALVGEGVAPIYFVEVPGWQDKDFDQRSTDWIAELRRRQHFDLRSWYHEGEQALREAEVHERMEKLSQRIAERILRGERFEQSLGNVDAHNAHFIGRTRELRRLQETVALKKIGVLTAVHGVGGMGKTALAIEYAHAFAHEYGGGRWQVRCEGREDLVAAITTLAPALGIEFTDAEKIDTELQWERVLAELRRLADAREPHRCLLILDNVDRPALLEPAQTQRLPGVDWLHVIATTRLGENDLFARHQDRAFVAVDEMPEADALDLIESFQPGERFSRVAEREAAQEIVRLLGCFTLAVETAAVFLGQFAGDVTCVDFLERLKQEGLEGLESAASETSEGVRHGEKRLTATRPSR
ncbi:MAG: toll/interleukin-1 receptor domain-containing protein [Acidobacteriota bacterium]